MTSKGQALRSAPYSRLFPGGDTEGVVMSPSPLPGGCDSYQSCNAKESQCKSMKAACLFQPIPTFLCFPGLLTACWMLWTPSSPFRAVPIFLLLWPGEPLVGGRRQPRSEATFACGWEAGETETGCTGHIARQLAKICKRSERGLVGGGGAYLGGGGTPKCTPANTGLLEIQTFLCIGFEVDWSSILTRTFIRLQNRYITIAKSVSAIYSSCYQTKYSVLWLRFTERIKLRKFYYWKHGQLKYLNYVVYFSQCYVLRS